jgi:3'-phosphoadenosine 5'-phosphosulfate sulfotransferase (PAPS reductase)/FAD synthetase
VRHVLSLSGGKDSAALAIYMRDRVPDLEYIFHDGGEELPETLEYLMRLEALLGRPITKTSNEDTFEHWLKVYGGMLPSNHRRWCTKMLKLRPFERYMGDDPVVNYVAIRADEPRVGYISTKPNIMAVYPFRDDGLVKADILRILEDSGLGMPPYHEWGRTRAGCYFCFYQQKIEWVRLRQHHPELFERAKALEEASLAQGVEFYWNADEPLSALERPERIAEIEANWEEKRKRRLTNRGNLPLVHTMGGLPLEDEPEDRSGCLICSI